MATSDKYLSYRIADCGGELCAVFKHTVPFKGIDGSMVDEVGSTERVLSISIYLWDHNGRDTTMLKEALAALQSAKAKPRGPQV